jgi:hypothetical protein
MKLIKRLPLLAAMLVALGTTASVALAFDSGGNPGDFPGDNTVQWTGQGANQVPGQLNTVQCEENLPEGINPNDPYLLWVFTTDGGSASGATLHLGTSDGANDLGDFAADTSTGNTFKFVTPYYTPDTSTLFAYVDFTVGTTGSGSWNLVISHGCPGDNRPPSADLTVTKTANGSYDRECDWTITKNALPSSQTVDAGQPAVFHYRVHLTATCNRIEKVQVTGVITVFNQNPGSVEISGLTDQFEGTDCTVDATDLLVTTIPANGSVDYDYTCDLDGNIDGIAPSGGTNTATVSWDDQEVEGTSTPLEAGSAEGTADPTFEETLTDNCVDVKDSVDGGEPASIGAGNYCVTRDESGDLVGTDVKISYDRTFYGPVAGTCADHNNTASFADNSTPQLTGEASASVRVCSFKAALTIGYWKTHMYKCPTGVKIGTNGCNNNGPFTSDYLGASICGGCIVGKLSDYYTADTTAKALAVFNANNCSNASTSDSNAAACLAAQLLAAELNVANGANTCICDTIKDAKAFLTAVGYAGPGSPVTFDASHTRAMAIALKTALDNYNNGVGCH